MAVWKPDFGEYDYVWDFICGVSAGNPWPEGNEDDLWVLAQEWATIAQALGDAMQDAGPVVNDLIGAWGGDSGYAFLGLWEMLGQSSESGLGAVADMAGALADMSDHAALELQYNKLTTLITVIITIISVFTALVGAFFTGGGSAAAIQPIMTGGRIAVQQSFKQLVRSIARKVVEKELRKELLKKAVTREGLKRLGKEAAEELVEEVLEEVVLVDGLSQAIQMAGGHRTSWDGSKTAAAAIGATAGVPIGMGAAPAVRWAKNRAGRLVTDRLADATIDRINRNIARANAPTTRLGGLGKQFAGTPSQMLSIGLVNAVTSPTASWIANGTVYGDWKYPTDSIMSSALAGASRANTISPPQLAAASLTGGSTGFRETLLGSHPAALDLGAPTTFLQPALTLPDAAQASFPDMGQTSSPDPASLTALAQTPSATLTSSAASSITAALVPDPTASSFSPDPTAALPLTTQLDRIASPAFNGSAEFGSRTPNALAPTTPVSQHGGGPASSNAISPIPDGRSVASAPAGTSVGNPPASLSLRTDGTEAPTARPSASPTPTVPAVSAQSATGTSEFVPVAVPPSSPQEVLTGAAPIWMGVINGVPDRLGAVAPSSPSGGTTSQTPGGSGSHPPASGQLLGLSDGVTANGSTSYRLENRQSDRSSDPQPQTAAVARELADRVDRTSESRNLSKRQHLRQTPLTAGALITRDGVIRAHTSMRGSTLNVHPVLDAALIRIGSELGSSAPSGHGRCAEVALISDFLHDFDASYAGPEARRTDAALAALAGAQVTSVRIEAGTRHGEHKDPCKSCTELLPDLNVIPYYAGPTPHGGIPPSVRNPAPREMKQPQIPNNPGGGRPIGEPGGLDAPDPVDQRALEDAVPRDGGGRPVRFPNPWGRWLGLVNDGGPAATPFRANNCLDTALSFLGTWHGNPQVSAPRMAEYYADDTPSTAGETDGRQRAEETLGADFEYHGATADAAFPALSSQLRSAGHGASAVLITSVAPEHGGGSHAWNAVNHNGTIHWIDAQVGAVSTQPLFDYAVDGVWSIVLDPDGRPVGASDPPTVARGLASIEGKGTTGSGTPAAHSVPLTTFAPDGRADHLPDLEPGELVAAAARVRPEDFRNRLVEAVDVGDAVTVRLRDGRSVRFEAAVGSGMPEVAATAVGRHRNVVTVNARVAPEQLARVWVHEIAAALQEKAPRGLFRRALDRLVNRGAGAHSLLEARLSERRYLIRALDGAGSVESYQEISRELDELDRHLAEAGARRLPPRPNSTLGALRTAVEERLIGATFAGFGVRVGEVDAGADRVEVRVDVVDGAQRRVGVVRISVSRDSAGQLQGRLEQVSNSVEFVTSFGQELERWFAEFGVSRIEVRGAGARSGFSWGSPAAAQAVFSRLNIERDGVAARASVVRQWFAGQLVPQDSLEAIAVEYPGVAPAAVLADLDRQLDAADAILRRARSADFGSPGYPSPDEVALAGGGQQSVGIRALGGVEWEGVKWLGPSTPAGARNGRGQLRPTDMFARAEPEVLATLGSRPVTIEDLGFADLADVVPLKGDPPNLREKVEKALEHARMIHADLLSFTQRSIGMATSRGMLIEDLSKRMNTGGWRGEPLHGVLWADGSIASLDNRRLVAAQKAPQISEVPFVAHSPDEPLTDWPHDWDDDRLSSLRLKVDVRELPDGSWVVGGDEGVIVHRHGDLPTTFGEAALFRAIGGRDFLVERLFGSLEQPVTVKRPWGPRNLDYSPAEEARFEQEAVRLENLAVGVHVAVAASVADLGNQLSTPSSVTPSVEELKHRYQLEQRLFGKKAEIGGADLRPFVVDLPSGDDFSVALSAISDTLSRQGFEPVEALSQWLEGNAVLGVETKWRDSHTGALIQIHFQTARYSALRSQPNARDWGRALSGALEVPVRKVHAHLRLLRQNSQAGLWDEVSGLNTPDALAPVWRMRDNGVGAWAARHPSVFKGYLDWLKAEDWTLGRAMAEFELTAEDLPLREDILGKLDPHVAGLLLAVREELGGVGSVRGSDLGPADDGRPRVGPPGGGLGLRPGVGPGGDLRPGELGPLSGGESGGSGGGGSGDYGRGDVAGRGDDSVALPVEGGAAGVGPALEAPADPAGGASSAGPAGPFARDDPAPPLWTTRQYGEGELGPLEDDGYLDDVKEALVTRGGYAIGADPSRSLFGTLINDGGIDQPGRDNNCLDCSLAALSSFYGRPEVSVPRWADDLPDGEREGIDRAMRWLGADTWFVNDLPTMAEQFQALHDHVVELGPGSAALVVNGWQDEDEDGLVFDEEGYPVEGASHATVVVYPLDADGPVWWDAQQGLTADGPPDWLVSGTVELAYITVEMDGRANGDESPGYSGSGTELPGSRRRTRPQVEHAPISVRVDPAVDSGDNGAERAGTTAGQIDLGARGKHGTDHRARAVPAAGDRSAVPGGDRGGSGSRGSADLPGTASTRSDHKRGVVGANAVGRIGEALLLRENAVGVSGDSHRDDAAERAGRSPVDPLGSRHEELEVQRRHVPIAGSVRSAVPTDRSVGGGAPAPGAEQRGPADGGRVARAVPAEPGRLSSDLERDEVVRGAAAAFGLENAAELAAVASAYDVATRWTAPYLVAAVDRLLRRLNPVDRGDVRFLFVTADGTVPWIVGRLAPDFARHHALWVQWPPTANGWRHLRAQNPGTLVTDDPSTLPAARPLLSPTAPGSRLVGRLHGPVPDSSVMTAAQRMAARAAVASVVRMAMRAGPETGRTAVYAAANELDRHATEPARHADALLAQWLR